MNIISHWMLEAANITCGDFEHNESEWEAANLTPLPSTKVNNLSIVSSTIDQEPLLG